MSKYPESVCTTPSCSGAPSSNVTIDDRCRRTGSSELAGWLATVLLTCTPPYLVHYTGDDSTVGTLLM